MKVSRVQLAHIAAVVLSLAASGCCAGVEDEVFTNTLDEVFTDEPLMDIRNSATTDEARCEAACAMIGEDTEGAGYDRILSCEAAGGDDSLPTWDPAQTEVTVVCQVEFREPGFCTGRRPLGHHEHSSADCSRAAHFAELAYLEAASIHAFVELAEWLERRAAPAELIERCRAAANDEVLHAELMAAHARRAGAEVEPPHADPGSDELLDVALHNAVEGCVNEAFAAVIALHQARACDEPELREVFDRVATDELRHGQLAWDLHEWLMERLDENGRARVEIAQRKALAALAESIHCNASRVPEGLGWPSPQVAARMAERFAASIPRPAAA